VDGVSIGVPDFARAYDQRQAILGRRILIRDEAASQLRLYDVATGKDIWKRDFPANSIFLKSEEDQLAGAVTLDGALTIIDVLTQKDLLRTNVLTENKDRTRQTITREELAKVQEAYLVVDRDLVYVTFNKSEDPNAPNSKSGVYMSVYPGIRSIPINGTLVAYDRGSGQRRWVDDIENQMLVLEQFDTLPVLFFTARHNQWFQNGPNRFAQQVVGVKVIQKSSGKLAFRHEFQQNTNQFHAIKADAKEGTIEMVSFNTMVKLTLERNEGAQSARAELPPQSSSSAPPVPQPPPPIRVQVAPQAAPVVVPVQIELAPRR
jgi:hypothetical protein